MKSLDTLKLDDATGRKNKFIRPRRHLTTMEIGEISVLMHEDMNPGDTVQVNQGIFSRLAPLAVPTYGQFEFKTATFFVDYYQLFPGSEGFFGGKTTTRGIAVHMPYLTKATILNLFIESDLSTTVTNPASSAAYDFCYTLSSSTVTYKRFTQKGKWIYKILRSLGYQIPNIVSTTAATSGSPVSNDKVNALAILAFLKAYNDYMSQSQRFDTSVLTNYLESVKLGRSVSQWYDSGSGQIFHQGLKTALLSVYLQYENDYFTSCWAAPNNPISSVVGDVTSIDYYSTASNPSRSVDLNTSNTQVTINSNTLTQRSLDFLSAFDRWVRRNNYSGSKDVEKIFSRFGVKPEYYKASYAHLVNTSSNPVQVGDVTSLTDSKESTSGAVLGDYAGKGIVNGDDKFSYRADDYGVLITLGWITLKPVYSNGYDRSVLRMTPLDWYNPEFDGLGGNPVSIGEVFVDRKNSNHSASKENDIFGFNERYDEYKTGNLDQITGDFCIYEDMAAWHFDRTDLKTLQDSGTLGAQILAFNSVKGYTGDNVYNRIFNSEVDDSRGDHFYVNAQFFVTKYSNMKNMNQVPNLGEGHLVVSRNGNTIS